MLGIARRTRWNGPWRSTSSSMSVSHTTDADLGSRSSSESSPNCSPGPRVTTVRPPRRTEALSLITMKKRRPGVASSTRSAPAGTDTSVSALRILRSSACGHPEKSQIR
jgi:hypothetical protein